MENLASKKVENMGKVLSWGAGRLRELKTYHISSTDAQPLLSLSIDLKTVRNSSPCFSREAFLLSVKVAIFLFYMDFFYSEWQLGYNFVWCALICYLTIVKAEQTTIMHYSIPGSLATRSDKVPIHDRPNHVQRQDSHWFPSINSRVLYPLRTEQVIATS